METYRLALPGGKQREDSMDSGRSVVVSRDVGLNLHPGETLRVALLVEDGQAETLVLALGLGQGRGWREDPARGGLEVPAEALPMLVRALEGLQKANCVLCENGLRVHGEDQPRPRPLPWDRRILFGMG